MIGRRLDLLEDRLRQAGLFDPEAAELLAELRAIVSRRNLLAHATLVCRPVQIVPTKDLHQQDFDIEWILVDRRTRSSERVSMARLRQDVYDAIGAFDGMLTYGQTFVDRAPHPVHYQQGSFLPAPGL